ncbi:MAG: LLM class flavin-dependent oxidoreductase [Candidatus Syntropharchaeia archaeon]
MEIGVPAGIVPPIENTIKVAKRLEEIGYSSMWYPDHFMGWIPDSIWTPDLIPISNFQKSPHVFFEVFTLVSAHACHTKRIKLGIGVSDTLRRHPVTMAQTMLTLDHISEGRVIFGLGAGEAENTIPYGIDFTTPVARFEENLRIIRKFLENPHERVSFDGKFWRIEDAVLGLDPWDGKTPQIWIGAHGRRMLKITGELGDGWIPFGLATDEYEEKLRIVRSGERKVIPALYMYGILAENHGECHEIFKKPLGRAWALTASSEKYERFGVPHPLEKILGKNPNPLTDYIPIRYGRREILEAMEMIPEDVLEDFFLHGNERDVIEKIGEYEDVGCEHIVIWNLTGMIEPKKYLNSVKILEKILKDI